MLLQNKIKNPLIELNQTIKYFSNIFVIMMKQKSKSRPTPKISENMHKRKVQKKISRDRFLDFKFIKPVHWPFWGKIFIKTFLCRNKTSSKKMKILKIHLPLAKEVVLSLIFPKKKTKTNRQLRHSFNRL